MIHINRAIASLTLAILLLFSANLTVVGASEQSDMVKTINGKTANITQEKKFVVDDKGTVKKEVDKNSYVFSLEEKLLKIRFKEEITESLNDKITEINVVEGTISIDPSFIDQAKTGFINKDNNVNITCQEKEIKKCMTREAKIVTYNDKKEIIFEKNWKSVNPLSFLITDASKTLAAEISNDLKALFRLLAPPKPEEDKSTTQPPPASPEK